MAQSIVPKRAEKAMAIFSQLGVKCSEQDFKAKFKELFPKDWQRVIQAYKEHEEKDRNKKSKGHPMPNPEKYLSNMYKTYLKEVNSSEA